METAVQAPPGGRGLEPPAPGDETPPVRVADLRPAAPGAAVPVDPATPLREPTQGSDTSNDFDDSVAHFDAQAGRAFLPGLGWRPSDEVVALYRERPHELPAGTDMYELHRLVAVMETARE